MGIKIGTTELKKVMFGNTVINKIYQGVTLIWEAITWFIRTGWFAVMTADSTPTPFVATRNPAPTSGSAFNAFDASDTSSLQWNYMTGVAWAKMVWTQPIRISKMILKTNRSSQPTTQTRVYGVKADASEILIYNQAITTNALVTVNSTDKTTPFVGIRIEIDMRSDLIVNIYHCRISEWYQSVWTLKSGYKWLMSGNSSPAPFVITGNDKWYDGANLANLWKAFDNTNGASQDLFFSRGDLNVWAYTWIDVVTPIKPKTFYLDAADVYGDDWGFEIHASNDGVNWTLLNSNLWRTTSFLGNIAVSSTNEYRYFRIGIALLYGSLSQIRLYKFLLTEWYE